MSDKRAVKNAKPSHFRNHIFEKTFKSQYNEAQVWDWLNDPKTFTKSQIFPYRVEFLLKPEESSAFSKGVLNIHHGPLLSLAGEIGEVNAHYRDLQYFYGSYAISFRLIRPYRLEFSSAPTEKGTHFTVKLSSFVQPSIYGMWSWSQGLFWSRFGNWMDRSIKKRIK
ncbi:hypothetical protein GCM10027429_22610 [Marivirga atlantica]|uniref:Uncharacterized protein n=1 Tax=Marivirga atlantica TaxID=1548457 RepID=A0A937AHY9_9BACT|nr:hypothetical protein [Marivirga atlantica]MBL0765879.1 hypothetical protein [Marivirga atlantica]